MGRNCGLLFKTAFTPNHERYWTTTVSPDVMDICTGSPKRSPPLQTYANPRASPSTVEASRKKRYIQITTPIPSQPRPSGSAMTTNPPNTWTSEVPHLLNITYLVMKHQVKLTVDLTKLPRSAWEMRRGLNGSYRRVRYELGLSFGAGGIEWRFLYQGKVMGSVTSDYV
jgi:hypothetical protein